MHAEITGATNEGTTSSGGSFFEEKSDSLPFVIFIGNASELIVFKLFGSFQHGLNFAWSEVFKS